MWIFITTWLVSPVSNMSSNLCNWLGACFLCWFCLVFLLNLCFSHIRQNLICWHIFHFMLFENIFLTMCIPISFPKGCRIFLGEGEISAVALRDGHMKGYRAMPVPYFSLLCYWKRIGIACKFYILNYMLLIIAINCICHTQCVRNFFISSSCRVSHETTL